MIIQHDKTIVLGFKVKLKDNISLLGDLWKIYLIENTITFKEGRLSLILSLLKRKWADRW